MFDTVMDILPWIALILLSLGYWSQVWKTHVHREVRDLSIVSYILLAIGFVIMGLRAFQDGSTIFLVKQLATLIPVAVLIGQIFYHRDDRWHDDADEMCSFCNEELEPQWSFCPYCGATAPESTKTASSDSLEETPNVQAA